MTPSFKAELARIRRQCLANGMARQPMCACGNPAKPHSNLCYECARPSQNEAPYVSVLDARD